MKDNKGQMLVAVLLAAMVLAIMIPAIIMWLNREAVWTVKEYKSTIAYNLAEAGIQRGVWKLKSSTAAWTQASKGVVMSGYNFDIVYADIPGGEYRIRFSSGPDSKSVTILSEGRSDEPKETRSIRAVYKNQTIPGAMITKGIITWANAFSAHWGPIMAHNNINITDANAAKDYFPRKYSRQVVSSNQGGYPRDTNGLLPPNIDSSGADEWYSDYAVPDLPELDWTALRSSAATNMATYCEYDGEDGTYWYYRWRQGYTMGSAAPANWISSATINTLNVVGCSKMDNYTGPKWWIRYRKRKTTGVISEASTLSSCNLGGASHNGLRHFQNPWRHPLALLNLAWYWDPGAAVTFTGSTGDDGCGIYGNIIVKGDLINYCGDNYLFTGDVPSEAWMEYRKIYQTGGTSTWDTATVNQYPADNGLRQKRATFNFGGETWTDGGNPPTAANTDVGLRGFLYVGGNYGIERDMDIYGAVWVEGNVSKVTGAAEKTIIFFNDNLDLPSLNVVLVRRSWDEVVPSATPWP